MKAIKEKGLRIPEDIAIIGFSDWKMASIVEPALSSVSQPDYEMGKKAIELITNEIQLIRENRPVKYETHIMETSLVLRESTIGKVIKKVPS
jgi:LacI family transcriptional regulator